MKCVREREVLRTLQLISCPDDLRAAAAPDQVHPAFHHRYGYFVEATASTWVSPRSFILVLVVRAFRSPQALPLFQRDDLRWTRPCHSTASGPTSHCSIVIGALLRRDERLIGSLYDRHFKDACRCIRSRRTLLVRVVQKERFVICRLYFLQASIVGDGENLVVVVGAFRELQLGPRAPEEDKGRREGSGQGARDSETD